jgi:hypothetical protein
MNNSGEEIKREVFDRIGMWGTFVSYVKVGTF